ncbi:MAG: dTDP-4-dehydrorhamnose reductase [Bacteroidales bacterium]|nr:dTDP-4-dehydrorhamnose reductase [Bacteroidales bacterium]
MKTILVTGAAGQLGSEMRNLAPASKDRYIFSDVAVIPGVETVRLDITDIDAVRLVCDSEKVDVIVNCAAYTNVDKAESDAAMADLLNNKAAGNLARVAAERGALLVHVSTDYVFGGDACRPYVEDSPTSPLGVYGATKLLGEEAVKASGCKYLIFRTAWLYSPYGKNFVKTMIQLTAERDSLKVVADQVGTPTYAADLASVIVKAISDGRRTGVYHFTDEGVCSWFDFACAIRDLAGNKCDIAPCRSEDYPSKAARPHYSVLDKTKVRSDFSISIPHWYESLKKCIDRL